MLMVDDLIKTRNAMQAGIYLLESRGILEYTAEALAGATLEAASMLSLLGDGKSGK